MRLITSLSYKFVSLLGSRSLVVGHTFTMTFKASSGRHETQIYTDYWHICNKSLPLKQGFLCIYTYYIYISFPLASFWLVPSQEIQVDGVRRRKNIWTVPSSGTLDFVCLAGFFEVDRLTGWPWKMMENPKIFRSQKNMDGKFMEVWLVNRWVSGFQVGVF